MTANDSRLLDVVDLTVHYRLSGGWNLRPAVHALDGVSVAVERGETLGVVGESGSGKTTLGRTILRRVEPLSGRIVFDGVDLIALRGEQLRTFRSRMQSVGQNPHASLNPRRRVLAAIAEPLVAHGFAGKRSDLESRVAALLEMVGLPLDAMNRLPAAFSGGQLQRICIARALAVDPEFIVADEPVSSLDVSIQAQVTNLFQDLQDRTGVAYLFISHDIAVVRQVSHRIVVMYAGKVVETGDTGEVTANPVHPYTEALLGAVPTMHRTESDPRGAMKGEPPDPTAPPTGCRFRTRCPSASSICGEQEPPLEMKKLNHFAACWHR